MVNGLYAIADLVFAIVLIMILLHDVLVHKDPTEEEDSYRKLLIWVFYFCLQDMVWGICGSDLVKSREAFWWMSTVFHISTILTTCFWLNYILVYLGEKVKHAKIYKKLCLVVVCIQTILLIMNAFKPTIFYISEDGVYCPAYLRPAAFFNQYGFYFIISIVTGILAFRNRKRKKRTRFFFVFVFAAAPTLSGIFQFLYPEYPFYSIGYFLGCIVIHLFVITEERMELVSKKERLQNEAKLAEQVAKLNLDVLTQIGNRRAYEEKINSFGEKLPEGFTYISMDVNGLKVANDELGHSAGDELLQGAVQCMKECFGAYGSLYRTGGDEFVCILDLEDGTLESLMAGFYEKLGSWDGEFAHSLTVAVGFVEKREFPEHSIIELSRIADKRMYKAKEKYYSDNGIDRRGQPSACTALCDLYEKILKVNLSTDSYINVRISQREKTGGVGKRDKFSEWITEFGRTGQVHPDDLDYFLIQTDQDFLMNYFREGNTMLRMIYRRSIENEYRYVMLEMIPADDYSDEHQTLFLYVIELGKDAEMLEKR